VLAIPPEQSWAACIRDNSFLRRWRALAQTGALGAMQWPKDAEKTVGGGAYATRFWNAVAAIAQRPLRSHAVERAQHDSIAQRLQASFLYPILFGEE
jgi:hypothetical protein